MRQINKRKSNKNLITHMCGKNPWKLGNSPKWPKCSPFKQKKKKIIGGRVLGLWKGGRQLTWRCKSKCLVSNWLLDHQKQWDSQWTLSFEFLHHTWLIVSVGISGDNSIPGQAFNLKTIFRHLERKQTFLYGSYGPCFFFSLK